MMIKNVFLNDFFSKTAKVKYASTKKAIVISKEDPSELYAVGYYRCYYVQQSFY
jgi:hypothetical protein